MTRGHVFFFIVALSLCFGVADALTPNDLRPKPYMQARPIDRSDRLKLIANIDEAAEKYQSALEASSWQSFKGLNQSPENVASLASELEDTRSMIKEFRNQLGQLTLDPYNTTAWLLALRSYYLVAPYIDDLDTHGIVESDAHVALRMWLPFVFDNVLLPEAAADNSER